MNSKATLITGGASGIGLAIARHFASQNANHKIAILDIDQASGQEVASSISAEFGADVSFIKCDVSSWDEQARAFKAVFEKHDGLDLVFANAGVSEQGRTTAVDLTGSEDGEDEPSPPRLKVLEVNLLGCVYSVKLAAHYMKKNKQRLKGSGTEDVKIGGSIICTASNAGLYPFPIAPLYGVSKAGVINLVRSLAKPLRTLDIQINALAPATVETNIAPDKTLFTQMVVTPMATVLRAVDQLLADRSITGEVAEIHGENVTLRPHHEYVDEDSRQNLLVFERLGYA
ncbi:hypothetical protein V8F20_003241 [Naviculisporaceae sp. PSN 640]